MINTDCRTPNENVILRDWQTIKNGCYESKFYDIKHICLCNPDLLFISVYVFLSPDASINLRLLTQMAIS